MSCCRARGRDGWQRSTTLDAPMPTLSALFIDKCLSFSSCICKMLYLEPVSLSRLTSFDDSFCRPTGHTATTHPCLHPPPMSSFVLFSESICKSSYEKTCFYSCSTNSLSSSVGRAASAAKWTRRVAAARAESTMNHD